MDIRSLEQTAQAMVTPGKGILAMDESTPTIIKRFAAVGIDCTPETRRAYRQLLVGTPDLGEHIAGAILYDETIRDHGDDGTPFPELLRRQGILPGIKVDAGAKALALHPGEKVTEGLDGLRDRLTAYVELGARFAKWRAVITIGDGLPSRACIEANAHALARYAALCQEAGLVPIVEPEVLLDGAHTVERCYEVTLETQRVVFEALHHQGVAFSGMVLKPSMVVAGKDCRQQADVAKVAQLTLDCLRSTVPAAVPGIAFLSGGQSEADATAHLNAMNVMARDMALPWRLTFSYARALQQPALAAWRGQAANVVQAQGILHHRARCNGAASLGRYSDALEHERAA